MDASLAGPRLSADQIYCNSSTLHLICSTIANLLCAGVYFSTRRYLVILTKKVFIERRSLFSCSDGSVGRALVSYSRIRNPKVTGSIPVLSSELFAPPEKSKNHLQPINRLNITFFFSITHSFFTLHLLPLVLDGTYSFYRHSIRLAQSVE